MRSSSRHAAVESALPFSPSLCGRPQGPDLLDRAFCDNLCHDGTLFEKRGRESWAVLDNREGDALLALVTYKKGAQALIERPKAYGRCLAQLMHLYATPSQVRADGRPVRLSPPDGRASFPPSFRALPARGDTPASWPLPPLANMATTDSVG